MKRTHPSNTLPALSHLHHTRLPTPLTTLPLPCRCRCRDEDQSDCVGALSSKFHSQSVWELSQEADRSYERCDWIQAYHLYRLLEFRLALHPTSPCDGPPTTFHCVGSTKGATVEAMADLCPSSPLSGGGGGGGGGGLELDVLCCIDRKGEREGSVEGLRGHVYFKLGMMYEYGYYVQRNEGESRRYLQMAERILLEDIKRKESSSFPSSCFDLTLVDLGCLYMMKEPADTFKALHYLLLAQQTGSPKSLYYLGGLYKNHFNDRQKALEYLIQWTNTEFAHFSLVERLKIAKSVLKLY